LGMTLRTGNQLHADLAACLSDDME
jgi:hypothetical protein